jgi:hypothetical protein
MWKTGPGLLVFLSSQDVGGPGHHDLETASHEAFSLSLSLSSDGEYDRWHVGWKYLSLKAGMGAVHVS